MRQVILGSVQLHRKLAALPTALRRHWAIAVVLVVAFVIRLRNLSAPIGGSYDFRQTQTAWGVRSMMRGSMNPLDAEVPVLGPPWKLPFEFPLYQWCAALLGRLVGVADVVAARVVAALFFVIAIGIVYLLTLRALDATHALAVSVVMAFASFGLVYGLAILIDFSSLVFALAALAAGIWQVSAWSRSRLILVFTLAALAHLSKITTSVAWLGIGLLIAFFPWRENWRRKLVTFGVAWVAVLPYVAWNAWADSLKSDHPASAFLASDKLREWTFGTLAQRLDVLEWLRRYESLTPQLAGNARVYTVLLLLAVANPRGRRVLGVCVAVAVGTPMLFTNLYRHEYYNIVLLPAYVVVLVLGVSQVVTILGKTMDLDVRRARTLLLASVAVLTAWSWQGAGYGELATKWWYNPAGMNDAYVEAVLNVRENTPDDAVLIVPDVSWDPSFLFHADRRGLILDPIEHSGDEFTREQLGTLYTYVYWFDEASMAAGWEKWGLDAVPREQINERLYRLLPTEN